MASGTGPYKLRIIEKLAVLNPIRLIVRDVSHLHQTHEGVKHMKEKGETHFDLEIVSEKFNGQSLLQRQRSVYALLTAELNERVHALSMKTKTPGEDSSNASGPRTS